MSNRLTALAVSVSSLALAFAAPAMAQSADAPSNAANIDDIVVTAQRRSENIREVPFAVTAMNQETLTTIAAGGADILSLSGRVPSLQIESSNGRYAPRFYIRGLGNVDFDFTASQPVSVVLDDVVLESVYLKGFPMFDVQQLEVLRGPQGTLFGRNTPAGVVKIDTVKPSDDLTGYGSLTYGNLGSTRAEAGVTLPLSDTLSMRVSGLWNHRDDWVNNAYDAPFAKKDGKDLGNFDDIAGRVHVAWTPTERLSALLTLQARDYDGTGTMNRANAFTKGSNKLNDNFDRKTVWYDGGRNNFQRQKTTSETLQVNYDFGPATLTGVVGAYQGSSAGDGDIDGGVASAPAGAPYKTPFNVESGTLSSDLQQNTYELRLASNGDNRLGWQVGAFYWQERINLVSGTFNGVGGLIPTKVTDITQKSDSWSVFGQANYRVTDALKVTAGVRYTEDNRDYLGRITIGTPVNGQGAISVGDEQVSWDVSALYEVNDALNLFARVAKGYRGPSIQGRNLPVLTTADSETVMSYEAGFKSRLWDGRARLNGTAYIYEVDDMQFTAIGGADNSNRLINAEKGEGYGLEFDGDVYLGAGFSLSAGAAWNHTEIKDKNLLVAICTGGCTVTDPIVNVAGQNRAKIDGNPFPQAPEYTANLTLNYVRALGNDTELFASTDWVMQKDFNLFLYNAVEFKVDTSFEGGLRAGWRDLNRGLEAAVYVRNITDEANVIGAIDFNNLTAFVNEPRTYGVQVSKRF
ncbi:iron complex outermembrane receptor protein [Brevundimonas nasdae]|uniref:TonB-dependent receptor n=2 Tax=Brevundimonas nasdae TaxID=172043 RepID=UPI001914D7EE|nr:TonB-dependent receptor [Brevundimonas nasdae]MBK6026274.1 TonB-dependent receptor [Brevundimonas nasdae]MDQ0452996.1 iron complex outermembrane receptor protein [Brevundimonas nasdae]